MSNILICLLGTSGSGKTTIANKLQRKYGYSSIKSYTTRPIRENDPNDINSHTFISSEDVDKYSNDIVASNTFNGYFYFATSQQIEDNDIYVVDEQGLRDLRKYYNGNKKIIAVYLDVPSEIVAKRMEQRGDSDEAIMQRIQHDTEAFKNTKTLCDYICNNDTQDKANDICEFIDMIIRCTNTEREDD